MSFFTVPRDNTTIQDGLGNEVEVGVFGAMKVAMPTSHISAVFNIPLNTEHQFKSPVTSGTGTVTSLVNRSLLKVQTGGTGSGQLTTKNVLRYQTGTTVEAYFTASFTGTPSTNDYMYIGLYDDDDGFYLGYNEGNFVVGYRNTYADNGVGSEPDVQQVVDMSAYDLTNIHRFRIRFGFLGVGNITYEIMNGTEWDLIHKFQTDAALSNRTHTGSAILPMRAESVSLSGADIYMYSGSWNAQTYDKLSGTQDIPYFTTGERTVAPSATGASIVGFKSLATHGGFPNKIRSKLLFAELATTSEGLYKFKFFRYPAGTKITTGTWNNISTFSPLQYNSTFTDQPDGADTPIFATTIAVTSSGTGVATVNLDFEKLGVIAYPDEEFIIAIEELESGAGSDLQSWSIAYLDLV